MSPRKLGDVRDDVSCILAYSERSEHGRQEVSEGSFIAASKLILRSTTARGRDNRYPQAVKALYLDTEGPPARYPHPMRGFTGRRGRGMESSAKGLTVRIS